MKKERLLLNKQTLRCQSQKKLLTIENFKREKAARNILSIFKHKKGLILSFASFRQEINLWPLNTFLTKKQQLVLPRVEKSGLQLYFVDSLEKLSLSHYGIFEPIPALCDKISPKDIRSVITPGLAFDSENYRLGYGKGYYDRLLPYMTHSKKIGVGFREQKTQQKIPRENTDHPLDQLLLF